MDEFREFSVDTGGIERVDEEGVFEEGGEWFITGRVERRDERGKKGRDEFEANGTDEETALFSDG